MLASADDLNRIENLFSAAIARDPGFAQAYAWRSQIRSVRFAFGFEPSETSVNEGRVDIETARRLAPNDALVMVAQAHFEGMADGDWHKALRSFEAAEAMGPPSATSLIVKGAGLMQLARIAEGVSVLEHAAELDPANPNIRYMLATGYGLMRRPDAALRTMELLRARLPRDPGVDDIEVSVAFGFTGNDAIALQHADQVLAKARDAPDPLREGFTMLAVGFYYLTHRFDAALAGLDSLPGESARLVGHWTTDGRGRVPLAYYRGWIALCDGRRERVAVEARKLQDFLAHQRQTPRNGWFLKLLASSAAVFQGQNALARRYAEEAQSLAPRDGQGNAWVEAKQNLAYVYAWTGALDQAAAVVTELATSIPGLPPVMIARDPALALPLAGNAKYREVAARIEDTMAHTKLDYPLSAR